MCWHMGLLNHREGHLDGHGALRERSRSGFTNSEVGEDAAVLVVLAVGLLCQHLGHNQLPQQPQRIILAAGHM